MNKYLIIAGTAALAAFLGYFGYLEWRVADLKAERLELKSEIADLEGDISVYETQIAAIGARDAQNKLIEENYDRAAQDIRTLPTGPVSPALRRAIELDVVR